MAFKLSGKLNARNEELHELEKVTYNGKKEHVSNYENKSITAEMYKQMEMSGHGRDIIYPKLDDIALIQTIEEHMNFCPKPSREIVTYKDALLYLIFPELFNRYKQMIEEGNRQDG